MALSRGVKVVKSPFFDVIYRDCILSKLQGVPLSYVNGKVPINPSLRKSTPFLNNWQFLVANSENILFLECAIIILVCVSSVQRRAYTRGSGMARSSLKYVVAPLLDEGVVLLKTVPYSELCK